MDTIPLWDQQLLSEVKVCSTKKLKNLLTEQEQIYMCSDGGAVNTTGSFGAVIASAIEILLELEGQKYGHTPRLFRSEACGMLAILRFLFHFKVFHNIICTITSYIVCDNSCLLYRVSPISKKSSPWQCLLSEADIELQIIDFLKQLQADPKLIHAKSHPNESIPVKQLPWNSQLNVQCDDIVSTKLKNIKVKPMVTMLPASRIMLKINGTSITHHQASQIRRAYSTPILSREYLTYHNKWENDFDTIDWETVHATYKKMPFHKTLFVTKWVNKLLPLNQQRYKWNIFPTPLCPSWCQQIEEEQHLLNYNHQARQDYTTAFQKTITSVIKTLKLDPYLQEIVQSSVCKLNKTSHQTDILHYQQIHRKELTVWTYSIFYRFFTRYWVTQQNKYLYFIGQGSTKNQALYAIKQIIQLCWDYV